MAAAAVSFVPTSVLHHPSLSGISKKQSKQYLACFSYRNSSLSPTFQGRLKSTPYKGGLAVRANYSGDHGRPSSSSVFVGGFILGGIIVGTLGCVYAPQISKALSGTDRKDLMRKLPKFIYDEEKALEKTRKILTEKIEQLNSAIDDVSSQLRAEYGPNGTAVASDEVEAAM
uniref:Bifunctional methyltransferase n=1 Tax=Anthurium amnicola TaxID=1678845 RepID=A0A1D1YCQ1_9ARAE